MTDTLCPVCGYGIDLDEWRRTLSDPLLGYICPCCAFHFGYRDMPGGGLRGTKAQKYAQWRTWWIRFAMRWMHTDTPPPPGWDPIEQLKRIGMEL